MFFSSLCCGVYAYAQDGKDSVSISPRAKTTNSYDATDLLHSIFKHHAAKNNTDSVRSKKVYVTALPVAGYSLQTGLAIALSCGVAFSADTAADQKVSSILTSLNYTQYHQVIFPFAASLWTKKNKYNIVLDYRFLKYPSINYGLGPKTTDDDAYTIDFKYIKLHQSILKNVYKDLYLGVGFYYDYFWDITEVDPPAGIKTSFEKYGDSAKEKAVGTVLRVINDSRQNQINPSGGSYSSIVFRPNFTFLGSDNNWQSLQVEYRKYIDLSGAKKSTLALWSYNWFTLGHGKPPYLLLPSTGWDDQYNTGRGYIQSRFRARQMMYAEAEYRFDISNNGFFGAVVFANAQSFAKKVSDQLNIITPGYGGGVRLKLNKHSNTNLCIDYGFGLNGSKGLFLNLGEVF
ncbi:MAG: BamA/TamA family outer membrane protein [Bacteroidetes bacterium]|nr:BamA/TamA family outer membrane protein [Bacteroidota bacterium]